MKRASIERLRTKSVWARHLRLNKALVDRPKTLQVGRFRKSLRIGGCGNAACWLCHAGKLSGEQRIDERRAGLRFEEGLVEVVRSNKSLERNRDS
jgi:hypothetical protein